MINERAFHEALQHFDFAASTEQPGGQQWAIQLIKAYEYAKVQPTKHPAGTPVDWSNPSAVPITVTPEMIDRLLTQHPLPVDGVCKCECNSTIIEIYNGAKLQCTQCLGDVLANPTKHSDDL